MPTNPLDKLNAKADKTTTSILKALKRAQDAVKLEILKASEEGKINTNAQEREKLFARVAAEYAALGGDMTKAMGGLVETAGKDATKHTAQTTGVDVPFDKTRLNAVWSYLAPANTQNLSAVFTDQMSENAIKKLRGAFLDTYRQAQVEGWTANETSKKMRDSWDAVAHDANTYRFVDKSGKAWENARYLQMLHRTTAMRVERDYTIDRMAEAGVTLYRIVGPSEECHICDAWQGQIIQMSRPQKGGRRLPTYAEALAAGMFHPNCVHYLEPMDEDWGDDAGEIARQEREKVPATMSPEAMQGRKDAIDKSRKIEVDGMTPEEAALSVTRDRIVDAVRTGLFDRELSIAVANGLSDADIGRLQASGIPKFRKVKKEESIGWRKGERGGVLRVPRDATADQVLALLVPKTSPKTAPKPSHTPPAPPPKPIQLTPTEKFMNEIGAKKSGSRLAEDKTNPNYMTGISYHLNCQRCAPTWEMRKRGYDVEALPKPGKNDDLSYATLGKVFSGGQIKGYSNKFDIEKSMAAWGDGARAQITCVWKGSPPSGHTFVAEQVNGKTRFFDPQTGADASAHFGRISTKSRYSFGSNLFMRTDLLEPTDRIKECCKPSTK